MTGARGSRDLVLDRIRSALRGAATRPGTAPAPFQQHLPPVGESLDERIALFAAHSAALRIEFRRFTRLEEVTAHLRALAAEHGWRQVATHGAGMARAAAEALGLLLLSTDGGCEVEDLERCDVGITECICLVAQFGSVVVTSAASGGRALSVLPPHHVVVARESQMVRDLSEAMARVRTAGAFPSAVSIITGPSRTGDIERILVLGAHGPKRLTVCLIP